MSEYDTARADYEQAQRRATAAETPEFRNFSRVADRAGLKNPDHKMSAFESFQASGGRDSERFLMRLQSARPEQFEMSTNQRMNAFLRG